MPTALRRGADDGSAGTTPALVACLLVLLAGCAPAVTPRDPLAAAIAADRALLARHAGDGGLWAQLDAASGPVLERAAADLRAGRRRLVLRRLAETGPDLAAADYLAGRPAEQRRDRDAFDAEWRRVGRVLSDTLVAPDPTTFAALPATERALAEAAALRAGATYRASRDYGHEAGLDAGLYYLGAALGEQRVVELARRAAGRHAAAAPPLRSPRPEIDALQREVLAAYRPPASVEHHADFIAVSARLKEARELDAAGLRYGALLRVLEAAQRFAPLRGKAPAAGPGQVGARLDDLENRLRRDGSEPGLGELFVEEARAAAARGGSGPPPRAVGILVDDVLPRYLAALADAPAPAPAPAAVAGPVVAVTLVRWPYT